MEGGKQNNSTVRRRRFSIMDVQKPANKLTRTSSNHSAHHVPLQDYRGHLLPRSPKEESIRPGHLSDIPTDIQFYLLVKKIRKVDAKLATIGLRFIVSLQWTAPLLSGHSVDPENLWVPTVTFLNNDKLIPQSNTPIFYPKDGHIKQVIVMDGNIANEMDLKKFPWDFDDVNLLILLEQDSHDRNVRLFWQPDRTLESSMPGFLDQQLTEWQLDHELSSLKRLPAIPGGFIGTYNGVMFSFYLERESGYYVIKVLTITSMLTAMSWCTMLIYDTKELVVATLQNETRRLALLEPPRTSSIRTIGVSAFVNRINFSCAVLLAIVAFQYLISATLPKTGYMTTMDKLLM